MIDPYGRRAPAPAPPAMAGFGHVRRYWEREHDRWAAKILPGEYYVTRAEEAVVTVLGSCVSACIRDPVAGIGGMNHFMLPEDTTEGKSAWMQSGVGLATRYGSFAMESLINDMLKHGARRERLEIKLFGGGKVLAMMTDVGARNVSFALKFMEIEGFKVVAKDLGGPYPRRIIYFPDSGRVMLKRLGTVDSRAIVTRERQYLDRLAGEATTGNDIELFD